MISKGLDFDKVSVVGILNADSMLNYPDFRAYRTIILYDESGEWTSRQKGRQGLGNSTDKESRVTCYSAGGA